MSEPKPTEAPSNPAAMFRYKPRLKLEPSQQLLDQMQAIGQMNVSQGEAAALLGVSRTRLLDFWGDNPEYREHYDAGRELRKVRTRRILDMHMVTDPATARFMAKNELEMSDDPSKAKADEAQARSTEQNMTLTEAKQRLLELSAKFAPKVIEHNPHEQRSAIVSRETIHRSTPGAAHGQASEARPPQRQVGQTQDAGRAARPAAAGVPGPADATQASIDRLQARLAAIEASAVRKNPRKDGQPHTDRTKAVDIPANSQQEGKPAHVPGRLPGRIGSR